MVHIGLDNLSHIGYDGTKGLDITRKTGGPIGSVFAPSWGIVMAWKKRQITWPQYRESYIDEMRWSWRKHRDAWDKVLSMNEIFLLCYCRSSAHCHRSILMELLIHMGARRI